MSANKQAAAPGPGAAPAKSKKKMVLIGALVGVLGLAGSGAAALLLLGTGAGEQTAGEHAAVAEDPHAAVPREAIYVNLEPPFVVNFQDVKGRTKFLKADVNVLTRDLATSEALVKHKPVIRNNLVMLLSRQIFEDLVPAEGKEKLRAEVLAEVRGALTRELPTAEVEDILFTSFVMQ